MKKEILEKLEIEVKACKKYTESSIKKSKEGRIESAINFLEIAITAKKCASQAHEDLWNVSRGLLTDEEFELFAESETLDKQIQTAYNELQRARK